MADTTEPVQETTEVSENEPSAELISHVDDKLSAIRDAEEGIEAPAEADTAEPSEHVDDDSGDNSEADREGAVESDAENGNGEQEQPNANATPTLPAAQVRSLKAFGWSDDEIAEAIGTPHFAKTVERIHATRAKSTQQWADLGRAKRDSEQENAGGTEQGAGQTSGRIDAAALKEKYGSDELIDELVGPINAAYDRMEAMLPDIQAGQVAMNDANFAAAKASVDQFFKADDMKAYSSAYGAESASLTNDQRGNRERLLEMADYIRVGSDIQGHEMTIHEAMGYAHEVVGSSFKAEAVRKDLSKSVKQRSASITLRPSTVVPGSRTGSTTPSELEKNVRERLASLGD